MSVRRAYGQVHDGHAPSVTRGRHRHPLFSEGVVLTLRQMGPVAGSSLSLTLVLGGERQVAEAREHEQLQLQGGQGGECPLPFLHPQGAAAASGHGEGAIAFLCM